MPTDKHQDEAPQQIGKYFGDSKLDRERRDYFIGGLAAGVLGSGWVMHWDMGVPDLALVIGGGLLAMGVVTVRNRGVDDQKGVDVDG